MLKVCVVRLFLFLFLQQHSLNMKVASGLCLVNSSNTQLTVLCVHGDRYFAAPVPDNRSFLAI